MEKAQLMMLIGQNLYKCREAKGLTQDEIASSVGISIPFLSNLERGNKIMSLPVLLKLADALEVSTDQLLYGNQDEHKDRLCNIIALLRDKPDSFIEYTEKYLRLRIEELNRNGESCP